MSSMSGRKRRSRREYKRYLTHRLRRASKRVAHGEKLRISAHTGAERHYLNDLL